MHITHTLPSIMIILGSSVSFFNTFCLLLRFFLLSINFHEPTDDTWNDFTDKHGNKLHVGKLEFKTKHGKKPKSFIKHVRPRDVKSALCLVIQLFLEQPKVSAEDSEIHDSLMQDIKKSAINEEVHANSFGRVSEFIISIMTPRNKRFQLLNELTCFKHGKVSELMYVWTHTTNECFCDMFTHRNFVDVFITFR